MKKYFLISTAVVMLAGSAMAADLPVKAPVVAAVPTCAQFGGFYVGGNVGWTYRTDTWTDRDGYNQVGALNTIGLGQPITSVPGHSTETRNSWEAGIQSGYNWQFHCTVFGIQGDWNWTDARVSNSYSSPNSFALPVLGLGTIQDPATLAYSSRERWFGTLRARSGVVVDNLLLYVTGGLAWANFNHNFVYHHSFFDPFTGTPVSFNQPFSSDETKWGFALGVGTEWALSPNWSIQSELLYMGFERDTRSFACVPGTTCAFNLGAGLATVGSSGPYRYEFQDNQWVARIGVNYRWGGAPALARY